jgi:hypothetical protein
MAHTRVTLCGLKEFARRLDGMTLHTRYQGAPFDLRVTDQGMYYRPHKNAETRAQGKGPRTGSGWARLWTATTKPAACTPATTARTREPGTPAMP